MRKSPSLSDGRAAEGDLQPRLQRMLRELLAGHSEKAIAARLNLSRHTVHEYVKEIYKHFTVSSRPELMAKWIRQGDEVEAGK